MTALIFCTSYVDSDPRRYQSWIDYYCKFFAGEDIHLLMINDGAINHALDLKDVQTVELSPRLGRQGIWQFPGWKRSFYTGLLFAKQFNYGSIAHIESDCVITDAGKDEFFSALENQGYKTGFCKAYNFPESALQVLNDPYIVNYFVDRYSCIENLDEIVNFELLLLEELKPKYILNGDRIEGKAERYSPSYTFLSGMELYRYLELLKNG